jgi:hypothetical protein
MWDQDVRKLRNAIKFMMLVMVGIATINGWSILFGPLSHAPATVRLSQCLNIVAMVVFFVALGISLKIIRLIQEARDLARVIMTMSNMPKIGSGK